MLEGKCEQKESDIHTYFLYKNKEIVEFIVFITGY